MQVAAATCLNDQCRVSDFPSIHSQTQDPGTCTRALLTKRHTQGQLVNVTRQCVSMAEVR